MTFSLSVLENGAQVLIIGEICFEFVCCSSIPESGHSSLGIEHNFLSRAGFPLHSAHIESPQTLIVLALVD